MLVWPERGSVDSGVQKLEGEQGRGHWPPTPLFHQLGMEGLDIDERMNITSQMQVKIHVSLNFQPVDGLQALPRLPEGRKEIKRNPNREKYVSREARTITVETLQKRLFHSD